jgi:adenylate cyclase
MAQRCPLPIDETRRSRWEWHEGEALLKLARYSESRQRFLASLRLLGRPVPETRSGQGRRVLAELLYQLRRRWGWAGSPLTKDIEAALQAVQLHQRLAEVGYWEHDILSLVHSTVTSLNIAEGIGVSRQLYLAYQVMGFVAGLAGSQGLFESYRRRAEQVGRQVEHLETAAFCAQLEAIYFNGQARWSEMEDAARRGGALFERIGDRFRWQTCVVLRAWGTLHQGDVEGARALFEEAERQVRAEGPTQVQVWCTAGLMAVDMACGLPAAAFRVTELEYLVAQGVDHSDAILCGGLLAKAHYQAGEREAALTHAACATALIRKLPPASFHTLLGNAAVTELRLAEWRVAPGPASRDAARFAIRSLGLFAMACPIAVPSWWRARAEFAGLDGRPARARRCQERALAEAARLRMRAPAEP